MGVEFYTCENRGTTFPDCGEYVSCETCGTKWCCDNAPKKMVMCENIANYIQI